MLKKWLTPTKSNSSTSSVATVPKSLGSSAPARTLVHSSGLNGFLSSASALPLLVYRFPLLGATHSLNDFLGAHPLLDLRL